MTPSRKTKTENDWTILQLLNWTSAYFQSHHIDSPRSTAEILLAYTLGEERITLYLDYDKPLHADELSKFKTLIKRRIQHEPVAYITGQKEFWGLEFDVEPGVLIPRPETECLVERVLETVSDKSKEGNLLIWELGVGSGALSVSLARELPQASILASDISRKALKVAKQNILKWLPPGRIHLIASSWFNAVAEKKSQFDLLVSNPPYIQQGVIEGLQHEIKNYEPELALDGGADGLASIRRLIQQAPFYLKPGGYLFLEIGSDQKKGVQKITQGAPGFSEVIFFQDYSSLDRVVRLRRS